MDAQAFNQFLEEELDALRKKLGVKGAEYVPGGGETSRFHNFEVAAALNGQSIEQALWGFVTKHVVSLSDMVKKDSLDFDLDQWEEKIGDVVIYMLLLKGMVVHKRHILAQDEAVIGAIREHLSENEALTAVFKQIKKVPLAEFQIQDPDGTFKESKSFKSGSGEVTGDKLLDISAHTDPVNPEATISDPDKKVAYQVMADTILTQGDWREAGDRRERREKFREELEAAGVMFMSPYPVGSPSHDQNIEIWNELETYAWSQFDIRNKEIDEETVEDYRAKIDTIFAYGDWVKIQDDRDRQDAFTKELKDLQTLFMRPAARGASDFHERKSDWDEVEQYAWGRYGDRERGIAESRREINKMLADTPKVDGPIVPKDSPSEEHKAWIKRVTPPPGAEHYT